MKFGSTVREQESVHGSGVVQEPGLRASRTPDDAAQARQPRHGCRTRATTGSVCGASETACARAEWKRVSAATRALIAARNCSGASHPVRLVADSGGSEASGHARVYQSSRAALGQEGGSEEISLSLSGVARATSGTTALALAMLSLSVSWSSCATGMVTTWTTVRCTRTLPSPHLRAPTPHIPANAES